MTGRKFTLDPEAKQALGRLQPKSMQTDLLCCLGNIQDRYEQAGQELIRLAQWDDGKRSLDDLMVVVGSWDPIYLANQLIYINPDLNLSDLPHLPVLEPLKAILRVLTISSLYLEGMR